MDESKKITAKVTDFGYSTLAASGTGNVFLPKSRPWNAPEHHFREFKVNDAKKSDVYSFGMLCFWILLRDDLSDLPRVTAEGMTESLSFKSPRAHGPSTLLERLKDEDKLEQIADQLMGSMSGLNTDQRISLKEFFGLTVPLNPEKREPDLAKLVGLLNQEG